MALGYERREMIDARGQFSVRGGIPGYLHAGWRNPLSHRVFGAEVDSIRAFDIDSQRSLETLQSVEIYPAEKSSANVRFFKAPSKIGKAYREAAKKAAVTSEELSEKIGATGEELREYAAHAANPAALENYIHYFTIIQNIYGIIWMAAA